MGGRKKGLTMSLDPQKMAEIVKKHFEEVTPDEFIDNIKRSSPDFYEYLLEVAPRFADQRPNGSADSTIPDTDLDPSLRETVESSQAGRS
jgi:hypothetical protein